MFFDVLRQYHGDGVYLEAFAVSAILVCYTSLKNQTVVGKKILYSLILIVLLVFNDVAYRLVGRLTELKTYYRFFWILPIPFLIAYVVTNGLLSKDYKLKVLAAVAFLVCILVGGNLFLTKANLHKPQND